MKSSLKNMVVVLGTITFISAACVGAVNMITEQAIADAKARATQAALEAVLPAFERTVTWDAEAEGLQLKVSTALTGGKAVGFAVETLSKNGFGGTVRLMVGFDTEGRILNINVLEQTETPGLGTKMCDEGNPLLASFKDKMAADVNMTVRKDGGDVDALTAATISSRAYAEAVARAYEAFKVAIGAQEDENAVTGATQQTTKGGNNGE